MLKHYGYSSNGLITNCNYWEDPSTEVAFADDQETSPATQVPRSHKQNHILCTDSWPAHCQQQRAHINH
ncbi:hypothetical protein Hanom_Chr06g00516561 [Helianthus anomalus]